MEETKAIKYINKGYHMSHVKIQPSLLKVDEDFKKMHPTYDFHTRCRYLIAKKLNISDASILLNVVSEWRKNNLPVKLSNHVRQELEKKKIEYVPYRDLQNDCPIIVVRSCRYDPYHRNLNDSILATIHVLESALKNSKNYEVCVFYDRSGFEFNKNWDFEYLKAVINILSQNYPETLRKVYIYPSGPILNMLWPMVKTVLDERTANKVCMPTLDELIMAIPQSCLP